METILYRYNSWWENVQKNNDFIERTAIFNLLIKQLENKQVVFITGLRRIGKTTLMKQIIYYLIEKKNISAKYILYVSLDNYLLQKKSIIEIVDEYMRIQNIHFGEPIYLFFDEITYKEDFEIQLKNLVDTFQAKIYVSSSSASLLKSKKAFLTGRSITFEVSPLNFDEYLKFKKIEVSKKDSHLLPNYFHNFLGTGGIPEYVINNDISYIQELVNDIIYKDIAALHNIRNQEILKEYFLLLMERAGKQLSLNKIASILKITPDTSKRYLEMFADTYLIHLVKRYGKTNETLLSQKKVYASDLGIRTLFTGLRDYGSLFENYIYLNIKHLNPSYIYKDGVEIDFITEANHLIEVKYHNEPLSEKQQIVFDSIQAKQKFIIRKNEDLQQIINNTN